MDDMRRVWFGTDRTEEEEEGLPRVTEPRLVINQGFEDSLLRLLEDSIIKETAQAVDDAFMADLVNGVGME